jgi:general secretion pathway protein I
MSCSTGSPARSRSSTDARVGPADPRGFTLIEVVVALVVLTLALGALLELFSAGIRATAAAEDRTLAVLLAQSRLAAIGVETPLESGVADGAFDDRFRWRAVIAPLEEPGLPAEEDAGFTLYRVQVTVSWGRPPAGGSVTLGTARLEPVEAEEVRP